MESPPSAARNGFGGSDANLGPPTLPDTTNRGPSRDVISALTYGLEMMRCGAMLVTEQGQVQLANRTALAMLQNNDGLALFRSSLGGSITSPAALTIGER